MVKISIVQMKSSVNKDENLVYSLDLVEEAGRKNAEMICFPEFQMAFSPSSQTSKELFSISETIEGDFIKALCNSAKKNNISILGTIYEREFLDPNLSELLKDKNMDNKFHVYDTVVYINNKGLIKSKYRKIHLYDALNFQESKKLLSGNEIFTPVDSPLGKMGVLVCYDLRFPELSRLMTLEGSLALISPSGWVQGTMKEDHWLTMCKARSIENGVYIIAPNQVGNIFCGRSLVVDPFGIVILDMGNKEGMDIVNLDMERITIVRNDLPLLNHRRTDLYDLK
ncbi:MAG TPA: carbon-nitrogen hydrolase family protein [Candidatus Nitrosocosmicus sp.]